MRQGPRIWVIHNSSPKPAIPAVKEFCREPEHCKSQDAVGNHPMPASSQNEEAKKHCSQIDQVQALRLHLTDAASAGQGWLSALSDKHMSIAITSMHHDPGHGWTLQSLAERVGLSRSVFALRFRETVGSTPMEYLTRWRMVLATDRLKNSSEGLGTIAQSLGYESESAFGKAFRRVMGCSPRQYARMPAHSLSTKSEAITT